MILFGRFSILFSAMVAVAVSETKTYRYEVVEEVQYDEDGNANFVSTDIEERRPVFNDDGFGVFTPEFKTIGGDITDVSTRGREVWVIKKDMSIYRFKNGFWQKIPGAAVNVGASADGWTWVVNSADQIFRFNANSQAWQHIPGGLIQISALSQDDALGVNRGKDTWMWKNGGWHLQPRSAAQGLPNGATWASIGLNDERWAIGPYDGIWRWDNQGAKWVQQPGAAKTVDVHSPSRIVVVNGANQVYAWVPEKKNWKHLGGKVAKRATVGDGLLITLGTDGFLSAFKH